LPSINRLHEEYGDRGLTVLLVGTGEPRETVARAVQSRGYTARTLLDLDGRTADAYRVRGTPTLYFIGRDGALLGGAVGPRPWTGPAGRALIQALLTGRAAQANR
jgi:hypothetical protein